MSSTPADHEIEGLSVTTEERDGITVVALSGELDLLSAGPARAALEGQLIAGIAGLVVDVSGLGFIDSAGLGVLVRTHKKARVLRTGFAVACPEGTVRRLLRLTGLLRALQVHDTREDALAALAERANAEPAD
ncbi:STAS domain-containing protein [Nocardioides sp. GY 10113]|uniref:STAS domain-containing protein n=1 Tax=Nocardioides sp. GY 10113 TaxID=2569761 RepID=UPI0010A778F5|nr:STAS domain-containing protein [Nocardioides sp. GY 10113]TIC87585.1 STAS domain-containing protein [Nocardioides sp. GY 10113]